MERMPVTDEQQAKQSHIAWSSQIVGIFCTYKKTLAIIKTNRKARMLVAGTSIGLILAIALLIVILNSFL